MNILTNVEASLLRYLTEHLTVPHGVKIFEDVFSIDFDNFTEWVVVDTLSNPLGDQPHQMYFLHIAQQKHSAQAKEALIRLVDKVVDLFEVGDEIPLYDYDSGTLIGAMMVARSSLQPVRQHRGGGSYRPLSMEIAYPHI